MFTVTSTFMLSQLNLYVFLVKHVKPRVFILTVKGLSRFQKVFSLFALYMLPSRPLGPSRPQPQPSVLQVVVACVGSLHGRLPRSSCS